MSPFHRTRTPFFTVLGLTLAMSVVTLGCSKEGGSKSGGKAPSKTAFAVFHKDASLVFGVNVKDIKKSKLYSMLEPQLKEQAGKELGELKEACGVDPFEVIEQIIVGGDQESERMIAVIKGVNKDLLTKCAEAMAKKEGEKIEITHDGKFTKVVDEDGKETYLAWLDDKTFITGGDELPRAELAIRAEGKDGLDQNEDMMKLLGNVDAGATVWVFGTPPRQGGMGPDFKAVYGSVNLGDGMALDVGLRLSSADEAKKTVEEAKGQLAMAQMFSFGKYLSKLKLEAKGADIIAKLKLSGAEVDDLVKLVQSDPMMKMMMGGGGGGMDMDQ